MEGNKITLNKTLDTHQLASFLRFLADELEGKSLPGDNEPGWQLHGFNKLKIKLIKQEGGQFSLRLKVKNRGGQATASPAGFTDIAEQEYRPFKQTLKATFAELTSCASQGRLPSSDLLARFMEQSRQLIAYPGFGDPGYDEYWQACQAMEEEVKAGGISEFQEKLALIIASKRSCHRRFK